MAGSGSAWADIPKSHGSYKTVYSRFCKWRDDGTLMRIFKALKQDADSENLSIDSTSVKAYPQSAGVKKGSKFGTQSIYRSELRRKTTKIHAVADGLGNPVHFILNKGNTNDSAVAIGLLSTADITSSNVITDKAYGSGKIRKYIEEYGDSYTVSPKCNASKPWNYDPWLYKECHLIECFFNKLKAFRRVATCFDKLASSFLAFVYISSIWILSK